MTIQLRQTKGIPLSNEEVDANFTFLNDQINLKVSTSTYTAQDVLTKIKTVDGSGSGLDADLLDGLNSLPTLPLSGDKSSIVARDASGNFSGNVISAVSFSGPLVGDVTGNVTGSLIGNASNVSGIVSISNGGTGATTISGARTNFGIGTLGLQEANSVNITGGSITGITDLAIVDGGTGASNAAGALANLGGQPLLGFTPVQQGGGVGQLNNKIYIGWDNAKLRVQVDTTSFGNDWPINISGNAATATSAANGGVTSVNGLTGAVTVNIPTYSAGTYMSMSGTTLSSTVRYTSGASYSTSGYTNQVGSFNDGANYFDVFPPAGKTMANVAAFIPSINMIHYAGGVDGNDSLRCTYAFYGDRIRVWVQNTEQRSTPAANWLAIWV